MATSVTNLVQYATVGGAEAYNSRISTIKRYCQVHETELPQDSVFRFPFAESGSAAATYSYATGHNSPSGLLNGISATLSGYLYKQFNMNEAQMKNATPAGFQAMGRRQINALMSTLQTSILNQASASFTNYNVSSGSLWSTSATALALREDCSENGWDFSTEGEITNTLLTKPALHTKILNNTGALAAYAYGNNVAITRGTLREYHGFALQEVDVVPSTVQGMALASEVVGLVLSAPTPSDMLKPLADRVETYNVIKTEDGRSLPFAVVQYFLPSTKTLVTTFETLWGAAVLNPKGGFNLTVTNINV